MVTEKEQATAKWVRAFEELDDDELILAYEICEKIIKIRNCHWRIILKMLKEVKPYEL